MAPNSLQFSARNDAIVIIGVHDVATDTSAETRTLEGKLDALVNLEFRAGNDAIVIRGFHDVATDTSIETRKLEGELDALVNLVNQLTANQKPTSVARVCGICSSNDHHTSVCPSSQQSGVDEHPEVYAANTYTFAETRKLKGKLDALVNLVTQLAVNQNPTSVARDYGIRSSNDRHTSQFSARNDAIVIRRVRDVAIDTYAETRKLESKLDALVNLVTQLAVNQKPASVARFWGIRSSNDHHTSFSARNDANVIRGVHDVATDTSIKTRKLEGKLDALVNWSFFAELGVDEHPEAYAANTYGRPAQKGVHDVATDTSAETRKLDGKLDVVVNMQTHLAVNQKSASVARVCGIRSSMTTILVSVLLRNNLEWMSIQRLMPQTPIADHHKAEKNALDREDGSQLLEIQCKK
ncbi:hypothetical protein Fmac_032889 [Flemingia macrophylla]|uniref:Uncharacterized protein n=1 Tax=Flemingia macrophylla TaxID=520843 RepID=A0ABD1L6L5_9FABA